jgi:hypothetical protein
MRISLLLLVIFISSAFTYGLAASANKKSSQHHLKIYHKDGSYPGLVMQNAKPIEIAKCMQLDCRKSAASANAH